MAKPATTGSVPLASPSFASQLLAGYSKWEINFSQNSQGEVRNIKAKRPEEEEDALGTIGRVRLQPTEATPKSCRLPPYATICLFNIKVTQNFHLSVHARPRRKYFVQLWFLLVILQFLKSIEKDIQGSQAA